MMLSSFFMVGSSAFMMFGRFGVCLIGHVGLPLSGESPGRSLAASIVFAARGFVVFSELNGLVGPFDWHRKISYGETDNIGV